ncbi:conidial yellow pigment biosynthesis polyketide synthase [Penicillium canescens]|nr:conidial yellow pigment biosynthesis polyketide synthase [Penicillium canescens]
MEGTPRLEAAATVKLDDRGTDSAFLYSPYWIDLLIYISGFVMNSNETLDHHAGVYIPTDGRHYGLQGR